MGGPYQNYTESEFAKAFGDSVVDQDRVGPASFCRIRAQSMPIRYQSVLVAEPEPEPQEP